MDVRPASTVILARDAPEGIEVFMLRRSSASRFAPDVYVFAGGTVDAEDRRTRIGVAPDELRRLFRMARPPDDALAQSLVACALRELREETGVLLDDASALELFSHWITPLALAPRYDVYFFVARVPEGQTPVADAHETHDGLWIAPARAIARSDEGVFNIIYPTRKHLERLQEFASVDALLAFARRKPIVTVLAQGDLDAGFALPDGLESVW